MSKTFFQGASHAAAYALYRPAYTPEVAELIVGALRERLPVRGRWNFLLDVGCGGGQSTHLFFPYFRRVLGIDPSANQIAQARKKYAAEAGVFSAAEAGVSSAAEAVDVRKTNDAACDVAFDVGVAEKLDGVESSSVDMIVAGQAAHWFDLPLFLAECGRTLVPAGLVALFGYATPVIDAAGLDRREGDEYSGLRDGGDEAGPARPAAPAADASPRGDIEGSRVLDAANPLNARFVEFYRALDWPPDRAHVETRYEKLLLALPPSSLASASSAASLTGWREEAAATLRYEWTLDDFVNYLATWSGYRRLPDDDGTKAALLEDLKTDLAKDLGRGEKLRVDFDVFVVFYRKRSEGRDDD